MHNVQSTTMDFSDVHSSSYSHLPSTDGAPTHTTTTMRGKPTKVLAIGAVISLILLALVVIVFKSPLITHQTLAAPEIISTSPARGLKEGVSDKSSRAGLTAAIGSPGWSNRMLSWQRSGYHFQPEENWMNDPNGVMYYKGWYHLFYQYNSDSAVWGNITWGHAVSRDMIHWLHLPVAMFPDQWYDVNGVWSGSATVLPDGQVKMLYTGSTDASVQLQNLAVPTNRSDPLLIEWKKYEKNPILHPPPGIGVDDFRDPTTAWYVPADSSWRILIGAKDANHSGISLAYKTKDFINYELLPGSMHTVPGTGMWECIDLYPVSTAEEIGLDTSVNGPGVKHVLKASLDDDRHDYYAIGSYDVEANTWTPDNPDSDVGIGLRLDYGVVYASKSFYDPLKKRRVLWGWVPETDSESSDILKGWASLQTIPRTVIFDQKTKTNLLQWPVEEVEGLRGSSEEFKNIDLTAGSVVPLDVSILGMATQLDITAEFEVKMKETVEATPANDVVAGYECSTGGGAAGRGALGPFGLLVLADDSLTEQTAVYFYLARGLNGNINTLICQDEERSSVAKDVIKRIYGSIVPVLDGEKLSLRILVDHSIVETYAQEGRMCMTSRVYPTKAIYSDAKVFLFNNATEAHVTATSVKVWEMKSAFNRPYNFKNTTANEF